MSARASGGYQPDIERYAPRIALEWLLRDDCARHLSVDGTLGFFDLSGFTRLSERLGRAGKIGVENVNAVVDRLYSGIIEPAVQHGGDVLQFSGDAILVLFTGSDHEAHAAVAAHEMQRFLSTGGRVETEMGAVRLRMSVGMHTGRFELVLLGERHRFLLAFGPGVTTVCQYEKDAEPGEVLCSPRLMEGLPGAARGPATRNGFLLNRRARIDVGTAPARPPHAPELATTFLFPDLRGKLEIARTVGGHRAITAAFIGLRGIDALVADLGPAEAADRLHAVSCVVEDAVAEFDVTWTTTDALVDGCHFMLTSQLLRTHEDDNDRMMLLARRVLEADTGLRLAVGANYGRVFVGDSGHPQRRVFTGFGDAINLAARVMNYAPDGIALATPSVLERTRVPFSTEAMPPFKAKGKSALVETYAIGPPAGGRRAEREREGATTPFIGRTDVLGHLRQLLDALTTGRSAVVDIVGDAGIGKSRVIAECRAESELTWRNIIAEPYARATPYGAVRRWLRAAIGARADVDRKATGAALASWCGQHAPELRSWLPLVALVVDADVESTPEVERLEPEFVRGRVHAVVADLLRVAVVDPMVVVVEDAHWLDDASFELVRHLADHARKLPVLWMVTRRPELAGLEIERAETIALAPLSAAETRELAIAVTSDAALPTDKLEDIVSRAGGNPLFASELAMTAPFAEELPESVEQVAAARIDALPIEDRMLLREASVLGTVVSLDVLSDVRGERCEADDPRWKTLADYLEPTRSGAVRFRHELLRAAAYEGLPYKHRQRLHDRTATLLEQRADPETRNRLAPILAFHFHTARRFDRSWAWSRRAAVDAISKTALYEAARHLAQALEAARHLSDVPDTERFTTAEQLGDVEEQLGRYDRAITTFAAARKLQRENAPIVARMYRKTARVESELGKHSQALRTVRRGLNYIDSLDLSHSDAAVETERAQLLLVYSMNRFFQGRIRDATRDATDALAVAQRLGDHRAVAQAHLQLATFYSDIGDDRHAQHRDEAMHWFVELGDDIGRGKLLTNMGIDAIDAADWNEALSRFAESAAAFERAGNEVAAWTARNNASEILTDQGRDDEARAILTEARRVFAAAGQRFCLALATSGLSRIELRAGDLDRAERLNSEALEMCMQLGVRPYVLDTEVRRVEWLVFADRADEALAKADDLVVAIAAEEATSGPTGNLSLNLARFRMWALLTQARFGDARRVADDLLDRARTAGAAYEEAMAYDGRARIAERTGTNPQEDRRAADQIFDRLGVVRIPEVPTTRTSS